MHKFDVYNMILCQKNAQKVDLGKGVSPNFVVFSTKSFLVIHEILQFTDFFFPPNTRELQGPPVYSK